MEDDKSKSPTSAFEKDMRRRASSSLYVVAHDGYLERAALQ